MPNYGVPNEKRFPADSGRILAPARAGTARFVAQCHLRAGPGFVATTVPVRGVRAAQRNAHPPLVTVKVQQPR